MESNREYKNTLFSTLFSEPEHLRELYNALADTNYGEDTEIEINTLVDVFFHGLKNDVSFTIGGKFVVLVEHQSTISNNMPLRCLMYIARVYEKIVSNRVIYQEKLEKIPTPEFIVLYNGVQPLPTEKVLKLSDAFLAEEKETGMFGGLELTVRVVSINPQDNPVLLRKSETLSGYSAFIERVRHNLRNGMELAKATSEAIKWSIEQGILCTFMKQYGSEVQNMLLAEFDIDMAREVWREEAHEKGLAEGRAEGRAEGLAKGLTTGRAEGLAKGLTTGRAEGLTTGRAEGLATGRAEGLATGRAEGISMIIQKMRSQGLGDAEIMNLTGIALGAINDSINDGAGVSIG